MARLIRADDKYLVEDGTRPTWSENKREAKRFSDDDPNAEELARRLKGEIVKVTNTKIEQRVLGRQRFEARQKLAAHEQEKKNGHR